MHHYMTAVAQSSRIQQDALNSPFLRLPGELRDRIFRYVIGDQLIHLLSCSTRSFIHTTCIATQSESRAYQEFKSSHQSVSKENPEEPIPFQTRHAHCKPWAPKERGEQLKWRNPDGAAQVPYPKLDLCIMRACKQTYVECSFLLWTTNTFSFEDPLTLRRFVDKMNTVQKKQLTTIHIEKPWISHESDGWSKLLNVTLLKKLSSLKTLHVTFFTSPWVFIKGYIRAPITSDDTEPTFAMKMLPLSNVTVVIADYEKDYDEGMQSKRWTISKKREVAEEFRQKLLDPQGDATFTAERKVKAAEKKKKSMAYQRLFHRY